MQTLQLNIGGMACSFCAESINKAYNKVDGVEKIDVSMAHEQVLIRYQEDKVWEQELRQTILDLGYTIRDPDKVKAFEEQKEELKHHKKLLQISGGFSGLAIGIMIVMWSGVQYPWFAYAMLTLALVTMFGPGWHIKKKAWQSARRGILNQHVLLELGAFSGLAGGFAGFIYPQFPKPPAGWMMKATNRRWKSAPCKRAIMCASARVKRFQWTVKSLKVTPAWMKALSPANRYRLRRRRVMKWSGDRSTRLALCW